MAKINIELDESEEKQDIDIYLHRYELLGALREVDELRRSIYKGWHNLSGILIRDKVVVVTDEDTKKSDYDYHGVTEYVDVNDVMDRLDVILEDVYRFIK